MELNADTWESACMAVWGRFAKRFDRSEHRAIAEFIQSGKHEVAAILNEAAAGKAASEQQPQRTQSSQRQQRVAS